MLLSIMKFVTMLSLVLFAILAWSGTGLCFDHQILDLNVINRPFITSFNLSNGEIVDCVKLEDQLAFQDPIFKKIGYNIKNAPTVLTATPDSSNTLGQMGLRQRFHSEGGSCPLGTIPILRQTERHLRDIKEFTRMKKLSHHGKRLFDNATANIKTKQNPGHHYAFARLDKAFYNGGLSRISVWQPTCPSTGEYYMSISQIWAYNDHHGDLDSAEVGWITTIFKPEPRLFISWTRDLYKSTGCYNLLCPGFIQTDPTYVLGDIINVEYGSSALFVIYKHSPDSDWWLRIENIDVGYWPREIYSMGRMQDGLVSTLDWGGETYSSASPPHVQMGNGRFGSEGKHNVRNDLNVPAHHALLTYLVANDRAVGGFDVHEADKVSKFESYPSIYKANIVTHQPSGPGLAGGTWIFFGGPGAPFPA